MSQYWGAYHGVALVLTESEFSTFLTEYAKKYPDIEDEIDDTSLRECLFHSSKDSAKTFDITPVLKDDCDGMILFPFMNENGTINQRIYAEDKTILQELIYKNLRSENCYAIFANKDFTSGNIFNPGYRYETYEDLLEEFKTKLETYLPDNFEWNSHIGDFNYACYA